MFCQECGTQNNDDAIFCEACGTKLQKEADTPVYTQPSAPVQTAAAIKPMRISKLTVAVILEVIVLIAMAFVIAAVGKKSFSPQQTAARYFVSVANENWEEAYQMLDVEESEFVNAKVFALANQNKAIGIINDYAVNKQEDKQDSFFSQQSSLGTIVEIDYRIKGSMENSVYTVSLNRQAGKKYFLFDAWKVGCANLICNDYFIDVPDGASVTLDGIALNDSYISTDGGYYYDEAGRVCYKIPQIFKGTHNITVTMEGKEDVTDTIEISYDNDSYYLAYMQWKAEEFQSMIQTAGADMKRIYAAAMEGKSLNTIKELFSTQEEYLDNIEYQYNILVSDLSDERYTPVKISFSDIEGKVSDTGSGVILSFAYDVEYTYKHWWNGSIMQDEYHGNSEFYFDFEKENGAWVLTNLGCESLYY